MDTPQADFKPHRFSSDELPQRDRAAALRDFFAPRVFGGEVEPLSEGPLSCKMTVRHLPGLSVVSAINSPLRFSRTNALLADGNNDYGLHMNSMGCVMSQRGRELTCGPGDAALVSVGEVGTTTTSSTSRFLCINISRSLLSPLIPHPDDAVLRPVAPSSEALRYLLSYIQFLESADMAADAAIAHTASAHLRDLFALVLGAAGDAAFVAEAGGLRAARLSAIKGYIGRNLSSRSLNISSVAGRYRLVPRTIQRMFEDDGMTFSEYVLSARLAAAYRMLADEHYANWTVSGIALEAGFGDLSYFNRCFRRRFGTSPTSVRRECGRWPAREQSESISQPRVLTR
jgi:AraC-like DNA-binding protein